MKSRLTLALKIIFVLGLLYFLGEKGFLSVDQTQRALFHWRYSVPGLALILFTSFLGVIRWQLLLRAHDIHLPFWRTCQLTYVGLFFNVALPGAVTGDFVKAFYVGKEAQGLKMKAFGSILFDRVAGLSALVVLSAGAFLVEMAEMSDSRVLKALQIFITVAALVVVAFYAYLFLVREKHDPLLLLFKSIEAKAPKLAILSRTYEALRHYHSHRTTVMQVLGVSLVIHLAVGAACLLFAYALGESQLSLLPVYIVVPLGLLVTAVPVAPAGVGTGHLAFSGLFSLLHCSRGADIYSLYALCQMVVGAIGGLTYLRFRASSPSPALVSST